MLTSIILVMKICFYMKKIFSHSASKNSHTENCPNLTFALECFHRLSKHFLTMFNALITSSKFFTDLNKEFTIAVQFPSSLLFNSFTNVKAIALNTE